MEIDKLTVVEVKQLVSSSSMEQLNRLLELVKQDNRKGVRNLYKTILRQIEDEKNKLKKKQVLLQEENKLWAMGYGNVGGLDEAGRGPLAGPVVAACVVFGPGTYIDGIDDSKKLSPARREKLFSIIMEKAKAVGIGRVDAWEIDRLNILAATRLAMEQAVSECYPNIDFVLVDAMDLRLPVPNTSLIKGDARSHSIAAASIIAKVTRDREMLEWHKKYPNYGFDSHKGYGTSSHIEAIREHGLCPIHRRTFTHRIISDY
ncbi:MAG: ribonuclease HII [Caldicoprobacterales bacterium]